MTSHNRYLLLFFLPSNITAIFSSKNFSLHVGKISFYITKKCEISRFLRMKIFKWSLIKPLLYIMVTIPGQGDDKAP